MTTKITPSSGNKQFNPIIAVRQLPNTLKAAIKMVADESKTLTKTIKDTQAKKKALVAKKREQKQKITEAKKALKAKPSKASETKLTRAEAGLEKLQATEDQLKADLITFKEDKEAFKEESEKYKILLPAVVDFEEEFEAGLLFEDESAEPAQDTELDAELAGLEEDINNALADLLSGTLLDELVEE